MDGNSQEARADSNRMRVLVVGLMLGAMLAGCSEEPVGADEEPIFDDIELDATDDTGVIRGVVIDATITPIQGATIRIASLELETTSNANGAFGFSGLDPGTYFMEASRIGYNTIQQSVEVVAGVDEPAVTKFLLEADPSQLPFVMVFQWDGFIQCSFSFIAACAIGGSTVGDEFSTTFELDRPGVTYLQSEAIWETTQAVSPNLQLWQQAAGEGGCTFDAQNAPSPNVINTTFGDYNVHGDEDCFRTLGNTTNLYLRMFSGSIDGTFPPTANGCYPPIPGVIGSLCMGVGATLQQSFTVYNHVFYGFKPVDGWQFSVDGTPDAPAA